MSQDTLFNQVTGVLGAGSSLLSGLSSSRDLFSAASRAREAGSFNAQVDQFNSTKRINNLARQVQRVLGTQGVQAASSGFRSTSKSFLAIKSATLSELERQIVEEKSASSLRQTVAKFNADSAAAALRVSARSQRSRTFTQLGQNLSGLAGLIGK